MRSVPSAAFDDWNGRRADLLDQLIATHAAAGGTAAGRRWVTDELNRAMLIRLSSQFQGYAKDLHTEAAITFGSLAQPTDHTIARVIATGFQAKRELDRGNPHEDALASDFGRFGMVFWDELVERDSRTERRRLHLRWLNRARNALAHDDEAKLEDVVAAGYKVDLTWVRRWRSVLNGLAGTMDAVMSHHLARLFGTQRPW